MKLLFYQQQQLLCATGDFFDPSPQEELSRRNNQGPSLVPSTVNLSGRNIKDRYLYLLDILVLHEHMLRPVVVI